MALSTKPTFNGGKIIHLWMDALMNVFSSWEVVQEVRKTLLHIQTRSCFEHKRTNAMCGYSIFCGCYYGWVSKNASELSC